MESQNNNSIHPAALLLNGEAAAVLASMRSSNRWSAAGGRYGENELEDGLSEALKNLRRKLFGWPDWSKVEPLDYLTPFLHVIKSPETSGTVTDVALSAVLKVLRSDILSASSVGVSEALHAVAEAVTQCKFEATYPAFDECVLNRILDVLVATVCSAEGRLLTHDNLINIFQACYRIGHYQTEKGRDTSELLTQASRRAMKDLVAAIFSRVDAMQSVTPGRSPAALLHAQRRLKVSPPATPRGSGELAEGTAGEKTTAAGAAAEEENENAAKQQGGGSAKTPGRAVPTAAEPPTPEPEAAAIASEASAASAATSDTTPHHGIVSLLSPPKGSAVEGAISSPFADDSLSAVGASDEDGYGIEALCEVLQFIVSFVAAAPSKQHSGLPAHGLDLVLCALHAAGPALDSHELLSSMLQRDLVKAMFAASANASLACLAGICQVALALYVYFNRTMLLQVEALLGLLLLPMAEGRGAPSMEAQQVALEGVLDFCNQPRFVQDIYLNLDCRIERSNLFEQICTLLSKAAFPVNGPVSSVHCISLDGIIAILASLGVASAQLGAEPSLEDLAAAAAPPPPEPQSYIDIWTPLTRGLPPTLLDDSDASPAQIARAEKHLKARLAAVAEHFNRDAKKGLQYCQSLNLLPPTLDPTSVARFLRCCPGLAKAAIGEVLGERDTFYDNVRLAFIETFDFQGMEFDLALRLFMDAFRPPGEGQKIDRIMQVFGRRYHEQMSGAGLKSADAAYVLAFSVIMLNTDLHNTQNKKKMSLKDFSRINDNTNDGEPMPKELLSSIYERISGDELKISSECTPEELPQQSVFWEQLIREAARPRGRMQRGARVDAAVERDMFALVWGPTLAAVSVILDGSVDPGIAHRAMDGLLVAARLATLHGVPDVCDQLLATLGKYTAALNPAAPKPALAFGESEKGRAAVEATFAIANRYGDSLHGGWRHVLDCVVRLHKAGLLTPAVVAADVEDIEDARRRLPRPHLSKSRGSSSSLFSRAINSLISIEGGDAASAELATAREQAAVAAAQQSVEACHVEDVIADSKFLTAESLVELVKATMWAGGNVVNAARTGEESDTAELALELLITLALRNRDRVGLVWPLIHEYVAACTAPDAAEEATPLVERAVAGLFRVCQRLLPYKEDTAAMLLASLRLVVGLPQPAAWTLSEPISGDLLALLKSSAPYIRSEADWRTVAALIRMTSARPEAVPAAFEALSLACRDPGGLSAESYMPLLESCLQLIDRYKGSHPEAAARFLDCADALFSWLPTQALAAQSEESSTPIVLSDESLVDLWLTSVGVMARGLCREDARQLRDTSVAALHRTLIASAPLNLPAELWVQTTGELLVPLVGDLAKMAASPKTARTRPGLEKTVRLAVNMLTKVLLQYVPVMATDRDFLELWSNALGALQACMEVRQEAVLESVPENVKNLLLVLASSGILVPDWTDGQGRSLWEITWTKAATISSGLTPKMLNAAGIGGEQQPPPPLPQPAAPAPTPAVAVAVVSEAALAMRSNGSGAAAAVAVQPPEAPADEATNAPSSASQEAAADAAPAAANGTEAGKEKESAAAAEEEEEAPPGCKQS